MKIAVVGAHLRGMPLHKQLEERGARFVALTRTRAYYQFFALPNTVPTKPGLLRTFEAQPCGIEVEIYDLEASAFGTFVQLVPSPLVIGSVELEDGETVKGFLVESYATQGATEITNFGGWRNYLASLS